MNNAQHARILDTLLAGRETLARRWYAALLALEPRLDNSLIEPAFLEWSEELLALLVREPFEAEAAQALGQEVAQLDSVWARPEMLVRTQEALAGYLREALTAEEIAVLQPRLARLYGELATGYFAHQVTETRKTIIQALPSISHELRGPINVIVGYSDLMLKGKEGSLTEDQRQDLMKIYGAGRRLTGIADELIDFARVEHGAIQLEPKMFSGQEIVDWLVQFMSSAHDSRSYPLAQGQTLEIVPAEALGELYADQGRVEQVLRNLVKFLGSSTTDGGRIRLVITRKRLDDRWHLVFDFRGPAPIEPSSPSIRPHHRDRNLRIARGLTELMGGTLTLQENELPVTTLELRLPSAP